MSGRAEGSVDRAGDPVRARRTWPVLAVTGTLLLGAVGGLLAWSPWEERPPSDVAGPSETTPSSQVTQRSSPEAPSGTPSVRTPSPTVRPTATSGPPPAPLPDLENRFTGEGDIRSDAPVSADTLQDGAFFALLQAADAEQRTVTVDVAIFLTGEEARAYLLAEDPERLAEGLDDGYLVVNEVERPRVLTVAPTARVGTWCFSDGVVIRERAFAEWAEAPALAPTTACSEPARQANEAYWLDVRDGVVAQITGQYLP